MGNRVFSRILDLFALSARRARVGLWNVNRLRGQGTDSDGNYIYTYEGRQRCGRPIVRMIIHASYKNLGANNGMAAR